MVWITESNRGRKDAVLSDILEETSQVGIKGMGILYTENTESCDEYIETVRKKISREYDSPAERESLRSHIEKRINEVVMVREYTGDYEMYYDGPPSLRGTISNSSFLRHGEGVTQNWKITRVDTCDKDGANPKKIPIVHSLLRVLEFSSPRGIAKTNMWLETGGRIPEGFYLIGLEDDVNINYFVGRDFLIRDLTKNNKKQVKGYDLAKRTYVVQGFDRGGEEFGIVEKDTSWKPQERSYNIFCSMHRFPGKDGFLWAVDELQRVKGVYKKILERQTSVVKRIVKPKKKSKK